jgi:hypothetical protein
MATGGVARGNERLSPEKKLVANFGIVGGAVDPDRRVKI